MPTKEKIRSLITIEGYAPTIKDIKPLGVMKGASGLADFEKALANLERKRRYSLLRYSAVSSIILLAGLFVITQLIPLLLVHVEFALTVVIWVIR